MFHRPHGLQVDILQSDARFRLAVCGRRWGKSLLASWMALGSALLDAGRVWVVGLTYEQTDRIMEPLWTFAGRNPGFLGDGTRRSERRIHTSSGGFIIGKSADHPDSLVGESLDLVVLDEAPIMPERVWAQQIRPCLSDRRGKALLIGTPRGHNWTFDLYSKARRVDSPEGDPEWYAWRAPSWTNTAVFPAGRADSEIAAAERSYRDAGLMPLFDQEYGASFTALQGRVYQVWDFGTMFVGPMDAAEGVSTRVGGIDWGHDHPCGLVVCGRRGGENWSALDEYRERGKVPEEVVAEVKRLNDRWRMSHWWADPSRPDMILACKRAGIDVRPAWNDVQPGIMAVAQVMARPKGFLVSSKCRKLAAELDAYCWREHPSKDEPVKVGDDLADALRYAVATEVHTDSRVARSMRIAGL